jgi:hypothetical protein
MFPLPVWIQGTTQPSTPVNDSFLRAEVLARGATSILSTPPGSPADGDVHIVGASPTGAWSTFAVNDVVLWRSGTWYRFAPFFGWLKQVGSDVRRFDGAAWVVFTGGGGGGAVPVQEEGTTVVASPTAINFVGAGVNVTNSGGVATVDVPGGGGGGAWDGTALLASNFEMAGTSAQLMPGLRFTPDASSLYELELMALVRSQSTSTAPQVSIQTSSSASIGGVSLVGQSSNTSAVFSFQTASGSAARISATTAAGPSNSVQLVIGRALFRSNAGPNEVRIGLQASDNSNTVTMLADSMLRWKKLA